MEEIGDATPLPVSGLFSLPFTTDFLVMSVTRLKVPGRTRDRIPDASPECFNARGGRKVSNNHTASAQRDDHRPAMSWLTEKK